MSTELIMSPDERRGELHRCETSIQKMCDSRWAAAEALTQIQSLKLWDSEYKSFDHYLKARWDWVPSRGYQLLQAHKTRQLIAESAAVEPPTTEYQCRALGKLESEQRQQAWTEAYNRADATDGDGNRVVPASSVAKVVAEMREQSEPASHSPDDFNTETVPDDPEPIPEEPATPHQSLYLAEKALGMVKSHLLDACDYSGGAFDRDLCDAVHAEYFSLIETARGAC